jgi:hypothetical protein
VTAELVDVHDAGDRIVAVIKNHVPAARKAGEKIGPMASDSASTPRVVSVGGPRYVPVQLHAPLFPAPAPHPPFAVPQSVGSMWGVHPDVPNAPLIEGRRRGLPDRSHPPRPPSCQ